MYQTYWGLKQSPFSAGATRAALAASPIHAEALARLEFLRDSRSSFGLLLGPGGSGKSAVLAEFAERMARGGWLVAAISAIAADELQLLVSLAQGLLLDGQGDARQLWQRVVDRLEELKLEGLTATVLLDDFDRASESGLQLVQRLLAFPDSPLVIVATARPETALRIGSRLLEQAALRIDLAPWSQEETRDYLQTSLVAAGCQQPVFEQSAAWRLFELSGGAPRRVNQLAQLALLAGAGQKLATIDAGTVEAVEEELCMAR